MNTVTQVTREEYVAIISLGGKAFGFNSFVASDAERTDDEHAARCLIADGVYDIEPDKEHPSWVYYALTE